MPGGGQLVAEWWSAYGPGANAGPELSTVGYNPFNTLVLSFEGTRFNGAEVRCRVDFPVAKAEQLLRELFPTKDEVVNGQTVKTLDISGEDQFKLWAREVLVSWDIEDENGAIPADEEGVLRAPVGLMQYAIGAWRGQLFDVAVPLGGKSKRG